MQIFLTFLFVIHWQGSMFDCDCRKNFYLQGAHILQAFCLLKYLIYTK